MKHLYVAALSDRVGTQRIQDFDLQDLSQRDKPHNNKLILNIKIKFSSILNELGSLKCQ